MKRFDSFASTVGACAAALLLLASCGGGGAEDGAAPVQALASSPEEFTLALGKDEGVERTIGDALATASGNEPRAALLGRGQGVDAGRSTYIVQMKGAPVTAYAGGVAGYAATRPARGTKLNPQDAAVTRYGDYLASRHDDKVARASARKLYSYRYAFNGFAAEMSQAQADKLRSDPDVAAVTKDTIAKLGTVSTPAFLRLDARGGLWSQLSGNANGDPVSGRGPNSGGAGEGVVVGVIDSGIWPENPSFSDRDDKGKLVYQRLPGWLGKCVPGEAFNASDCNRKLIAAQYFGEGFGGGSAIKALFPYEFISPRAADGHGVHTAGTAAGNYGVAASINGTAVGTISGMAPRARVAVYKACWGSLAEGGCANSDMVAAIDQAVADGVDVLNFSISGSSTDFLAPVEIAFLFAADAGVFVAAAAFNTGPTAGTVQHPSPWVMTVAASTHDRGYANTLTLGNGTVIQGVSQTAGVGPALIVNSDAVAAAGADVAQAALCFPGTLDSTKVSGKIVVCDRGTNARVEKSEVVRDAGGVGMVLANVSPDSLEADLHEVPSIHIADTDRPAVRAYASAPGATATISAAQVVAVTAPLMASFSSRGPLQAGGGDLLKPDITAPGVDVIAAYSPTLGGQDFAPLSGTSMSSPHIAGIAALFKQRHPTWSPMAIKSAIMTTAYQRTRTGDVGQVFGTPFDFGAGHVNANRAVDPGLVFDSGFADWLGFLCGTQLDASVCADAGVAVIDASDMNVASVAIGDLAGIQTVKRRVTNVSGAAATFTARPQIGSAGLTVAVSPASFTLGAGETTTVSITITNVSAPVDTYRHGAIVWTSNAGHVVRIPVVVKPVALAAPAAISGTGGAMTYDVGFGYTGPFTAALRGLVLSDVTAGTLPQDPDQSFDPADTVGTVAVAITIPAGTTYARLSIFGSDAAAGSDLDVYVYEGDTLVALSATSTADEEVNFAFANPTSAPRNLVVYVHAWGTPAGGSPFALNAWLIGTTDAGNSVVTAPSAATLGTKGTVTVTPDAALGSGRWMGSVVYSSHPGLPVTIIRVDK